MQILYPGAKLQQKLLEFAIIPYTEQLFGDTINYKMDKKRRWHDIDNMLDETESRPKRQKTEAEVFDEVKRAIEGIKDSILRYEADNSEGSASRYYLRWIYRALAEIAIHLHKKGYNNEPEAEE